MSGTRHVRSVAPDRANAAEGYFHRTPRRAIEALLDRETFPGRVWEPACGDGAISEILVERGYAPYSTDLFDRGYGTPGVDFLAPRRVDYPTVNCVVMNPPYGKWALPFVLRALEVADTRIAALGRLLWLEGGTRYRKLYRPFPPARVYVFSERVNVARMADPRWLDGDGGMVAFAWYVWDVGYRGETTLRFIPPRGE